MTEGLLNRYRNKDITDLSSEDIIKLVEYPYTMNAIADFFGVSEEEFKKLKKQKKVENITLESVIRNIETILDDIDKKYSHINNQIRQQIIDTLISVMTVAIPRRNSYKKKLSEIDFSREKVIEDLMNKEVNTTYRLIKLDKNVALIEKMVKRWIEEDSDLSNNYNKSYNQRIKENFSKGNDDELQKSAMMKNNLNNNTSGENSHQNIETDVTINTEGKDVVYHVCFSNEGYQVNEKSRSKVSKGAKHNYQKENETKRLHGKIGEEIVLQAERNRLIQIGLANRIDAVNYVARFDEETTFDGLGYDLISVNEKGDPICIEVKTSYGKKDKPFFISKKELEVMKGLKKEHDCKDCLIYYVKIDNLNVTIKTINAYDLDQRKLTPVLYKVEL